MKGQNNFWKQNVFLACSWGFLRFDKLEQLEFELEKNIGIYKLAGKVRKLWLILYFVSKDFFYTTQTFHGRIYNHLITVHLCRKLFLKIHALDLEIFGNMIKGIFS